MYKCMFSIWKQLAKCAYVCLWWPYQWFAQCNWTECTDRLCVLSWLYSCWWQKWEPADWTDKRAFWPFHLCGVSILLDLSKAFNHTIVNSENVAYACILLLLLSTKTVWFGSVDMAGHIFLLKFLFIAKLMLFNFWEHLLNNLLLILWWEVMCRVWGTYRLLWCLCFECECVYRVKSGIPELFPLLGTHSVFAYRFWTNSLWLYFRSPACKGLWSGITVWGNVNNTRQRTFFFLPPPEWEFPCCNTNRRLFTTLTEWKRLHCMLGPNYITR